MTQARNLAGFAQTANASGFVANTQITGVVANSAAVFTSAGFRIVEESGKLTFKYGANTIGTLDSSGNFKVIGNIGAFVSSP